MCIYVSIFVFAIAARVWNSLYYEKLLEFEPSSIHYIFIIHITKFYCLFTNILNILIDVQRRVFWIWV